MLCMQRRVDCYSFRPPLFAGVTMPLRNNLTLTAHLTIKNSFRFYFPRALPGWVWEAKTWSKSKLIQVRNFSKRCCGSGTFFGDRQTRIWIRYKIRYLFDVRNITVRTIRFDLNIGYITSSFLSKKLSKTSCNWVNTVHL